MDETSGILRCRRQLCNNHIGQLRFDNIFVALQSYRICDLVFESSITENTPLRSTHLTVNYLVELDQNNFTSAASDPILTQVHTNENNGESNHGPIDEATAPNVAPIQVAEVGSSSDILEILVNEILADDEEFIDPFDGTYEYIDFNTLYFNNDYTF